MQTAPKPSFLAKYTVDILVVSIGALAIVVFLSVAFIRFDATNLPSSNSSIDQNNHGVIDHSEIDRDAIDHGTINQHESQRSEPREDLVALAALLSKTQIHLVSYTSASLADVTWNCAANLDAVLSPDDIMWRYTTDGWRDISLAAKPPPTNKPLLEGVHPVIWTAMLLLLSLLLLIKASSDEEIKKLFRKSSTQKTNR